MANISSQQDATCHGVLHRITLGMFQALSRIESAYDVIQVVVTPYAPVVQNPSSSPGEEPTSLLRQVAEQPPPPPPLTASTFIVPPSKIALLAASRPAAAPSGALPSDRYVRIITSGLQQHGVDPTWSAGVARRPTTPSRTPDSYLKYPVPPCGGTALPKITAAQLSERHAGRVDAGRVITACGKRVLEIDTSAHPTSPFVQILKDLMSGRDLVFGASAVMCS